MAIFFKTYLLIYFRLHWVLIATGGLSLIVESGGFSLLRCVGSHCDGFSRCRTRALGEPASVVEACGL